jgi:broad specificity phosphatase PhoE
MAAARPKPIDTDDANFVLGPELPDISSSAVRAATVAGDQEALKRLAHPAVEEWLLSQPWAGGGGGGGDGGTAPEPEPEPEPEPAAEEGVPPSCSLAMKLIASASVTDDDIKACTAEVESLKQQLFITTPIAKNKTIRKGPPPPLPPPPPPPPPPLEKPGPSPQEMMRLEIEATPLKKKLKAGTITPEENTRLDEIATLLAPPPPERQILFLRHGEGVHNASRKWSILDPPLTEKGEDQAAALAGSEMLADCELLVVSPLSRAIQTAVRALPWASTWSSTGAADAAGGPSEGSRRVVLTALHSERYSAPCDGGQTKTALAEALPCLREWEGFAELAEDWSPTMENDHQWLQERVPRFKQWLAEQPELRVVVVGHGAFFKACLGEGMGNCEIAKFDPATAGKPKAKAPADHGALLAQIAARRIE